MGGSGATDQLAVIDDSLRATLNRAWIRLTSQLPARALNGTDDPGARPD